MNARSEERPIVAIAQARSFEKNELFVARHSPLVNRLADHGILAVALNGAKDRGENNVFNVSYTFDHAGIDLTRNETPVVVHSGLDLSGGLARYTPDVPALNPLSVREVARSKQLQHDVLRDELGEAVARTVTCAAIEEDVIDALDQFDGGKLIVKANGDPGKKHKMLVGEKAKIAKDIHLVTETMDPEKETVIIQEYMPEVKSDFASGIQLFDESEQEVLTSRRGLNREIRVHAIDGEPVYVTGRAGLDPDKKSPLDTWIYLDQGSIPSHVRDLAGKAATLIHTYAGAEDSYLAVDITPDGERIVEVNGRNIGTVRLNEARSGSRQAQAVTTDALVDKLASMAHRRKGW